MFHKITPRSFTRIRRSVWNHCLFRKCSLFGDVVRSLVVKSLAEIPSNQLALCAVHDGLSGSCFEYTADVCVLLIIAPLYGFIVKEHLASGVGSLWPRPADVCVRVVL